ncbi:ribbon-helix-helix protein, CopG family [Candidatus Saccharibacteria bacterium]|jgi:metal-responsive CopG/Arc/MetJ family transcriptional regulator|nr:ribbon-helix-helix protein, CopG family [Candidatus Saccharibacteria bacterium]
MNENNQDQSISVGPVSNDQLTVSLPANLIAQIDAVVGSEFTDRDDFIRAAVRHYLEYLQHVQRTTKPTDIG